MNRFLPIMLVLCLVQNLFAQETRVEHERLKVTVTAVAGSSVYIDKGRESSLEPGDELRLLPLGGAALHAVIRDVSRSSARAELVEEAVTLEIGTEGEVLIPVQRLAEPSDGGTAEGGNSRKTNTPQPERAAPDHPAWQHAPLEWDGSSPLLAPIEAIGAADRERNLRGRVFTLLDWTRDSESGSRDYLSSRTGLDAQVDNVFGKGGLLDSDLEFSRQVANVPDGDDESDSNLRLDRLSYRWGGDRDHVTRWEGGRFLQHEFPEFGVIDGVEYGRRLAGGSRIGASLGFLPEPRDEFSSGDDLSLALFGRWVSDPDSEDLVLGLGAQKTWHRGTADRDLVVSTLDWKASETMTLRGTAWIDFYTSDDTAKGAGSELTQLQLHSNWRFDGGRGLALYLSQIRWPELLRNEYDPITAADLADNHVQRLGLRGWTPVGESMRLSGRLDQWSDQDDSGNSGDLRWSLRDKLWERGEVSLALHGTSGKFSSGSGLRLGANRRLDAGFVNFSYDMTDYEQDDFVGGQSNLLHHVLRGSWDFNSKSDWDFSLWAEQRFGDQQGSSSLGFLLQKRL